MISLDAIRRFYPEPLKGNPSFQKHLLKKICALLSHGKGRDYYDVLFLLAQTAPDYAFLAARCGIYDLAELKAALENSLQTVDLTRKCRDFEHQTRIWTAPHSRLDPSMHYAAQCMQNKCKSPDRY
jgi:predicted nucleotidyltransferase component of viral defense system